MDNKNRIFIGEYREFHTERTDLPSMKDFFEDHPYPGQGKIIYFLMHGIPTLIGMKSCYDIFTGEYISSTTELLIFGDYEWWKYLAHYVKDYNLRLPPDFEAYILSISSREIYENYKRHFRQRKPVTET